MGQQGKWGPQRTGYGVGNIFPEPCTNFHKSCSQAWILQMDLGEMVRLANTMGLNLVKFYFQSPSFLAWVDTEMEDIG